jgi:hypothetical protein
VYLLDANVFIDAKNNYYGFDFVPAFWDWLDRSFEAGLLRSIEPIAREIASGKDELSTWAAARPRFFLPVDEACGPSLTKIAAWATTGHYSESAANAFLGAADFKLVAYGHTHNLKIVTLEVSEPNRKTRIKIPDACEAHGVDWTGPFPMLRDEKASFVLP